MDKRVEAIRSHPKVGRGTCSVIDETWSDQELVTELDAMGANTTTKAVAWAVDRHDLWADVMEDIWGHGGCRDGDWL